MNIKRIIVDKLPIGCHNCELYGTEMCTEMFFQNCKLSLESDYARVITMNDICPGDKVELKTLEELKKIYVIKGGAMHFPLIDVRVVDFKYLGKQYEVCSINTETESIYADECILHFPIAAVKFVIKKR